MKILFLDMDKTVRVNKEDPTGFINKVGEQELIRGAERAIAVYKAVGWKIIGVSNQAGVGEGFLSLESCIEIQRETISLSQGKIEAIYFCPEIGGNTAIEVTPGMIFEESLAVGNKKRTSGFRKPECGMLELATERIGVPCEKALMVGDREEDEKAAIALGIDFKWARDWWG